MENLPLNLAGGLLASSPISVILFLMVGLRWGAARAGPAGWLTAFIVGFLFLGATPELLAYSQLRGVLLSLFVLYIIWMALLLYNVVNEAGAIDVISEGISRLTGDKTLQLLILGWVFSAFLQGVAGFGVPIAVVAPLLLGLGFEPVVAVVAPAIGHSWSVTFGDIASSFNALIATTGLSGLELAPWSAFFLGVACFGCGLSSVHACQGRRALRHSLPALLVIGSVMASVQYLLATRGLWNLAGFVAGMAGLVAAFGVARLAPYRGRQPAPSKTSKMGLGVALSAYLLLIVMVTAAELWPPLHRLLNQVVITVYFPQVETALGWVTEAGMGRKISLFSHAGALLAYASILAYFIYRRAGLYKKGAAFTILSQTARSAIPSTVGIASMVGMAMIMDHTGMTIILAQGLSRLVGQAFPFLSPFIGLLGAFMTGSNTNSNVVFAPLQKSTAELIGAAILVILGAQTTGGSLGSMLAPAKIIVGCSTAGLEGREGLVLRKTIGYGLAITALVGGLAWLITR